MYGVLMKGLVDLQAEALKAKAGLTLVIHQPDQPGQDDEVIQHAQHWDEVWDEVDRAANSITHRWTANAVVVLATCKAGCPACLPWQPPWRVQAAAHIGIGVKLT